MKDPKDLPTDIYTLLEEGKEPDDANIEWAKEVFGELLRSALKKRPELRGEEVLRFSSLGKQDRQLWYAANKPETAEKLPGKLLLKFQYGHMIELMLLFLAKESGHEVTHLQHEVEADGVHGHMDAVIDGVPIDVKSASPFAFQKFADGSFVFDDAFGYVPQLSGYSHEIGKTDRAGFLVADKVAGGLTFAELDQLTIEANPPRPKIIHQKEIVNRKEPPERCYPDQPEGKSGNRRLGIGCSYCPFREECWKDSNNGKGLRTFWYSRGPVMLTTVVKEPLVAEV